MTTRQSSKSKPADDDAKGDESGAIPAVVPSPEVRPHEASPDDAELGDAPVADSTPDGAALPPAEHFHEHGVGPELTPAGAHRHSGGDEPHDHPLPPRPPDDVSVVPRPREDTDGESADASYVVDRDCTAVVDGQVLNLAKGQRVEGSAGKFLADSGAPVSVSRSASAPNEA